MNELVISKAVYKFSTDGNVMGEFELQEDALFYVAKGLQQEDNFVVVAEGDSILLKRIRKEYAEESMQVLLETLAKELQQGGKKK